MATIDGSSDGGLVALDDAREVLRVERRRVVDEREAFRAFRDRIESVSTEQIETDREPGAAAYGIGGADGLGSPSGPIGTHAPAGSGLVAVRDAYAETVMSVPHYDIEYDDTYERSLAAEFGPEIAFALTRTARFHAEYKRSLLAAVDDAIDERELFAETIGSEIESVDRAASRLTPIDRELEAMAREEVPDGDFGALDACRARTNVLRSDCDRIAVRRQREIVDHERSLALDGDVDLATYLYQDLSVTYPVLAAIGTVGDRIDALRRDIEREIAGGR
ncbi:DUF7260 family protein [Halorubrum trueperi]|uniref:DUF7260 domain-containing protein n=1 Tax=Halorubrum trueperi TaxID=2004704 RepID=A0ABD5UMS3_9EURY